MYLLVQRRRPRVSVPFSAPSALPLLAVVSRRSRLNWAQATGARGSYGGTWWLAGCGRRERPGRRSSLSEPNWPPTVLKRKQLAAVRSPFPHLLYTHTPLPSTNRAGEDCKPAPLQFAFPPPPRTFLPWRRFKVSRRVLEFQVGVYGCSRHRDYRGFDC